MKRAEKFQEQQAKTEVNEPVSVVLGDCVEALQAIPSNSIPLCVTSPPYARMGMFEGDDRTFAEYAEFSREWLTEVARVLSPNGSAWINVGYIIESNGGRLPLTYAIYPVATEIGLHFQQEIVWVKPARGVSARSRFTNRSERWMWFTKSPTGHTFNADAVRDPSLTKSHSPQNNPAGRIPTDVWEFSQVRNSKDRMGHPCPFPVAMIERIILGCSDSGDVVLDPFSGTGTTGVAAIRHDRKFVGIERDGGYALGSAHRVFNEALIARDAEIEELRLENARLRLHEPPNIEQVISKSLTMRDALKALGRPYRATRIDELKRDADERGIDLSHMVGKGWRAGRNGRGANSTP